MQLCDIYLGSHAQSRGPQPLEMYTMIWSLLSVLALKLLRRRNLVDEIPGLS